MRIARAAASVEFPARVTLVGAMNPCPCGYFGHPLRACRCTPPQRERYAARISGPLLDRIDLCVEVPWLPPDVLGDERPQESSARDPGARRARARASGRARGRRPARTLNALLSGRMLRRFARPDDAGRALLARGRRAPRAERPRARPHPARGPLDRRPRGPRRRSSPTTWPRRCSTGWRDGLRRVFACIAFALPAGWTRVLDSRIRRSRRCDGRLLASRDLIVAWHPAVPN